MSFKLRFREIDELATAKIRELEARVAKVKEDVSTVADERTAARIMLQAEHALLETKRNAIELKLALVSEEGGEPTQETELLDHNGRRFGVIFHNDKGTRAALVNPSTGRIVATLTDDPIAGAAMALFSDDRPVACTNISPDGRITQESYSME